MYRRNYNVVTENLANNPMFETEIASSLTLRFAAIDYPKLRMELIAAPGWKARTTICVRHVMETGIFKSAETAEWTFDSLRSKFLCADRSALALSFYAHLSPTSYEPSCRYKPLHKFQGNCTLIRAEQGAAREEDVGKDYGLSSVRCLLNAFLSRVEEQS